MMGHYTAIRISCTWYNIKEPQTHYAKWKTQNITLYIPFICNLRKGKSPELESRSVFTWGQGGGSCE